MHSWKGLAGSFAMISVLGASAIGCSAATADESSSEPDESNLTEEQALGSPAPAQGPEPTGKATKHPIVLAHGFMGTDSSSASFTNVWAFYRVADALRKDGHVVHEARVQPFNSPKVRAEELKKHVDLAIDECKAKAGCDASKVNLVAHSMGGLDCRVLVSQLGYGDRVASLTTISTPHAGSNIADVGLNLLDKVKADDALDKFFEAFGMTFTTDELARQSDIRAALTALAEKSAPQFAAENPDDRRVFYQSWAGVSNVAAIPNPKDYPACGGQLQTYRNRRDSMDALLVPVAAIVAHGTAFIPNDGMATVESAKHGLFRGCIPADHFDEVGQIKDEARDKRTGFDHQRFYRNVAFDLAKRGF
jgi:triacylglycerol lipase